MIPISANVRGAAWMSLAMAAYVTNDALMKVISAELDLFQALFLRGVMTIVLLAGVAGLRGELFAHIPRGDRGKLVLRVIGEIGATVFFLLALFNMPLANATAILQSLPLAVTLGAALFLGERVGWRRYTAIVIGFAGVMVIVRPGSDGFNVYSLAAVASVLFIVLRDLTTRRLSAAVPSIQVSLLTAVAITALGGAVSLSGDVPAIGIGTVGLLAAAAVFVVIGYVFGVMTMRVGEIAFVAPFRYTSLLWAIILGFAVFGDIPGLWTLIGAAIVVGMGIYTFYRERVRARMTRAAERDGACGPAAEQATVQAASASGTNA